MKSPLMRLSNLFDETRGLAGWEAGIWVARRRLRFCADCDFRLFVGRLIRLMVRLRYKPQLTPQKLKCAAWETPHISALSLEFRLA
jgi:hypothetical protein